MLKMTQKNLKNFWTFYTYQNLYFHGYVTFFGAIQQFVWSLQNWSYRRKWPKIAEKCKRKTGKNMTVLAILSILQWPHTLLYWSKKSDIPIKIKEFIYRKSSNKNLIFLAHSKHSKRITRKGKNANMTKNFKRKSCA